MDDTLSRRLRHIIVSDTQAAFRRNPESANNCSTANLFSQGPGIRIPRPIFRGERCGVAVYPRGIRFNRTTIILKQKKKMCVSKTFREEIIPTPTTAFPFWIRSIVNVHTYQCVMVTNIFSHCVTGFAQ